MKDAKNTIETNETNTNNNISEFENYTEDVSSDANREVSNEETKTVDNSKSKFSTVLPKDLEMTTKGFRITRNTKEKIEKIQERSKLSAESFILELINLYSNKDEDYRNRHVSLDFGVPEEEELKSIFSRAIEICYQISSRANLQTVTLANKKNETINILKAEIEELKNNTAIQIEKKEDEVKETKQLLEQTKLQKENDQLSYQNNIQEKDKQIEELKKQLNEQLEENKTTVSSLRNIEKKNHEYLTDLQTKNKSISELNDNIGNLNTTIESLSDKNSNKENEIINLKAELNDIKSSLKNNASLNEERIKLLNDQIEFYKKAQNK